MPPSPAFRCSPGSEPRSDSHKRGRSLESGLLLREKDDDDLALFNEMQSRERENFLLQSSDDLEDSFSTKLRHFSDTKLGITIPGRGETNELLNADGDKNDYDWLLTPPDTPLFPSLDDEPPEINVVSRGRPRSKPISISRCSTMETSYRSSRGSASPNRVSSSPRSGNNTLESRGSPSSALNSSPTQSLRHATPSRRPSTPPAKAITPGPRSSTPTPRRISTSSVPTVSSGIRGTSPVKTSRGNSASPKIRAWQTNIPGLSSDAPPNLRTSLADRPTSYVRGSSPASRNGRDSASKFGRQSMSPTASRSSSSFYSHDRDLFSSRSKGSVISSGDDDLDSLQSIPVGSLDRLVSRRGGSFSNSKTPSISKKSARMVSQSSAPKRSFDSALRQMDRKSPQNMFRPLLSSVPSTTFYAGKTNSAQRSLVSRNFSVTTSSNASSDHGTSFAASDHNQDDAASETEKILYTDIHEEVFSFDKFDLLNANIGHEINNESVDVLHNKTGDPKIDLGLTESEDSVYHGIDTKFNESLETSHVTGDISLTDSFENTAICSHCGCCYEVTDEAEKNIRLCPECSRKNTLLRHVIAETTLAVSKDSPVISANMPAEEKSLAETDQLTVVSELPQETDVSDVRFPLGEPVVEESQTLSSEFIQDHSQLSPLPSSLVERSEQMPTKLVEVDQLGVDYKRPDNHSGDQQLYHSKDHSNLKEDLLEGTGISVLLKRSSSSKGPVFQSRTFTATTISYDDLSFARSSVNSFRSSTGRGSFSASSSVDFSSARHSEFRVQRQSSGRKLDTDRGYDIRIKPPPSPGSSFSGMSNISHHRLGLATQETSVNTECGNLEETPLTLQMEASEDAVTDVIDASSMGSMVIEEDKPEYHDHGRITDACSLESVSQATGVQPDDNSVASFPNHGDCIDNIEDHTNNTSSVSNTETSVKDSESSLDEKHDMENSTVDGLEALVTTVTPAIEESEIKGENYCQNDTGVVDDDPSLVSKSTINDFQEHSVPDSSNDCLTASVSELNASEYSHDIEESTVTVDCLDGGNTKSLTLEEATDTILFCSSIIHDLAYQAATMAMEKEHSEPLEGSEPTVTVLGTTNSNREDSRRRTSGKRTVKPQKAKPKTVETDVKSPSVETENDENKDVSLTHNVGLPNKVDSIKPPNKLESKCNCIIM
ncbi:mucin-17 [Sesbania bispinosa]|nr:mucin-17 [Sesbania bispinosa]